MHALIVHDDHQSTVLCQLQRILRPLLGCEDVAEIAIAEAEVSCLPLEAGLIFVCLSSLDLDRGLELIRRLQEAGTAHLLAVGQVTDPKLILRTIQTGADVFVDEAELVKELPASLSRLRIKQEAQAPLGGLLAILSASGGCGSSTLAVNIAAVLAKEHDQCMLIDLNPGQGDLASLLDLKAQYTLADVCRHEARLDRAMFEKVLVHDPSGIRLLAAPADYEDVGALTIQGVSQALNLSRRLFAEVVVDVADCFHREQAYVLQQATAILLVCRLDFTALRNARRILHQLSRLGVSRTRIRLVINQYGRPSELPVDEAEDALGEKLNSFVPHDPKTINAANNTGVPLIVKEPGHRLVQCFKELSRTEGERIEASWSEVPKGKTSAASVTR